MLKHERAKIIARDEDSGKKRQAQAQQDGNGSGSGVRKPRLGEMRADLSFKDWVKS